MLVKAKAWLLRQRKCCVAKRANDPAGDETNRGFHFCPLNALAEVASFSYKLFASVQRFSIYSTSVVSGFPNSGG